jgi:hypothetical protein
MQKKQQQATFDECPCVAVALQVSIATKGTFAKQLHRLIIKHTAFSATTPKNAGTHFLSYPPRAINREPFDTLN